MKMPKIFSEIKRLSSLRLLLVQRYIGTNEASAGRSGHAFFMGLFWTEESCHNELAPPHHLKTSHLDPQKSIDKVPGPPYTCTCTAEKIFRALEFPRLPLRSYKRSVGIVSMYL